MKHCPRGGADHKQYYVRISRQVVQCLADGCNRPFLSTLLGKERERWNAPDAIIVGEDELIPTPIPGEPGPAYRPTDHNDFRGREVSWIPITHMTGEPGRTVGNNTTRPEIT